MAERSWRERFNGLTVPRWPLWLIGVASLVWLVVRSGSNPRRLSYPCQRAALAASLGLIAPLLATVGLGAALRRLACPRARTRAVLVAAVVLLLLGQAGGRLREAGAVTTVTLDLPGWTSAGAVSDVFVVGAVPVPQCSLASGALPATAPCNDPAVAFADAGVDRLVATMGEHGSPFLATATAPAGLVGADDVVVVKVNNQWGGLGDGSGRGRLATNTDVLKGVIWAVVSHPDGFTGEVVVAENTQYVNPNWDITPANAEDQDQSLQDVVTAFQGEGYPVSLATWDYLNDRVLTGGTVSGGVPPGEYQRGDDDDGYVLLEDPAGSGRDELSYPKFTTANGTRVSLRYGVWNGSSYQPERLKLINLPVLKRHWMAGSTIAWKNLIGFLTIADDGRRFGDWDRMHDFFWGYLDGPAQSYGLIGRQLAQVRAPDLNLVDAIWVGTQDNTSGNAVRADVLVASSDPFAVDWYASEYVLRPVADWEPEATSAARGSTFRAATRVNQNAAEAAWPDATYPWIDLLDDYDGATPSAAERDQMNAYVAGTAAACSLSCSAVVEPAATVGEAVVFAASASATGCAGQPSFSWDFGDGSTSASEDPSHAYGATGSYGWTLVVSADDQSCRRQGTVTVTGGEVVAELLVPAVIHAPGEAGTRWRTALGVGNPGAATVAVELSLVTADATVTRSIGLGPDASTEWGDVVVDLFELDDAAEVAGVVHLAASGAIVASSRTYNQTDDGTFGQAMPALATAACLAAGESGRLLQLKSNDDFRTNVGVANLGGAAAQVRVVLLAPNGDPIGSPVTISVAAGSWKQRNDIFAAAAAGHRDLASAVVEVVGGDAVWVYASLVDNRTGDATTLPVLRE